MPPTHEPPAVDPDHVPETLCIGKFNITPMGSLVVLTFTHTRPRLKPLLDDGDVMWESVVRARIVTTTENLVALRDVLNKIIRKPVPLSAGGGTRVN